VLQEGEVCVEQERGPSVALNLLEGDQEVGLHCLAVLVGPLLLVRQKGVHDQVAEKI